MLGVGTISIPATATQLLEARHVSPRGLPINLVASRCRTPTPVAISFIGQIADTGVVTVAGTCAIPSFEHCGGLDGAGRRGPARGRRRPVTTQ